MLFSKALPVLFFTAISCDAAIIYKFVGTGINGETVNSTIQVSNPEPVAFQLTLPTFENPPNNTGMDFLCSQLDSSQNCGATGLPFVGFSTQNSFGAFSSQLQFDASNGLAYFFLFPTGAFATLGTSVSETGSGLGIRNNSGTLTVSATPEPTTAGFLVLGSGALLAVLFRNKRRGPRQ
jgi:PEP-CTERM motif